MAVDIKKLFNEDDFALLDYLDDDGTSVEPRFYVPILPLSSDRVD